MIRRVIGNYNCLVGQLGELVGSIEGNEKREPPIHPASLLSGSGRVAVFHRLMSFSEAELDCMVEQAWDPSNKCFLAANFEKSLRRTPALRLLPPEILDPMTFLRQKFSYRKDESSPFLNAADISSHASQSGYVFGNEQDLLLCDETWSLFRSFDQPDDGSKLGGIIGDTFHNLNYEELTAVLKGLRSMLQLSQTGGKSKLGTFDDVLGLTPSSTESDITIFLDQLGFPQLNCSQIQLLSSMKAQHWEEVLNWIFMQLSSETYQFSALPLSTKHGIPLDDANKLDQSLSEMNKSCGFASTMQNIDVFVRDILATYESLIAAAAQKEPNKSLVFYLRDDNPFCDEETDPNIFPILPLSVCLKHYVSLRGLFHCFKLKSVEFERRASGSIGGVAPIIEETPSSVDQWLWDDHSSKEPCHHGRELLEVPLWFEQLLQPVDTGGAGNLNRKRKICMVGTSLKEQVSCWSQDSECEDDESFFSMMETESFPEGDTNSKFPDSKASRAQQCEDVAAASTKIQRWWRQISVVQWHDSSMYYESFDKKASRGIEASWPQADTSGKTIPSANLHAGNCSLLYGNSDEEDRLRSWLNKNKLPNFLADMLQEKLAVRNLDDLVMLVNDIPDQLDKIELLPLDRLKLVKAAASAQDTI